MRNRTDAVRGSLAIARFCAPILASTFMLILVVTGCAEREVPTGIETHGDNWKHQSVHGARVVTLGPEYCKSCHEDDFSGNHLVPGCYECHNGPGGHTNQNMIWGSAGFHARVVEADGNSSCTACHGDDFRGGWSDVSCYTCHAGGPSGHPELSEWLSSGSSLFHGDRASPGSGADSCKGCHGEDFLGGTSGVSCSRCHPYPP